MERGHGVLRQAVPGGRVAALYPAGPRSGSQGACAKQACMSREALRGARDGECALLAARAGS